MSASEKPPLSLVRKMSALDNPLSAEEAVLYKRPLIANGRTPKDFIGEIA